MQLKNKKVRNPNKAIFFIGALAILILAFSSFFSLQQSFALSTERLRNDSLKVSRIISDEITKYVFGLQGAKGALVADQLQFNPERFHDYAESRQFFNNFKSALGFGFIRFVKNADLNRYRKAMSHRYRPFKIHPNVESEDHMILELFEPYPLYTYAMGLDLTFEGHRSEAALRAARTGEATISKPISFIQKKENPLGFIYFLPIYRTIATPLTEFERMEKLIGWAHAPLALHSLIQEVSPKIPGNLDVQIKPSGTEMISLNSTRYRDSYFFHNNLQENVPIAGQIWTIQIRTDPASIEALIALHLLLFLIGTLTVLFTSRLIKRRYFSSIAEKNSWLKALINSAGYSVIASDKNGIITNFNAVAERMLQYRAEEVVGKTTPALIHDPEEVEERAKMLSEELGRPIAPGFEVFVAKARIQEFDTNEWTYIRKDGSRFPARLRVSAIRNDRNNAVGFIGVAEDLSEMRALQKTIEEQKLKMISSARLSLLGEMAGGIAHEINTPLAVILGKIHLFEKRDLFQNDPETAKAELKKISRTAQRIADIIQGLLTFTRGNDTHQPFRVESFDSILHSTLDLCNERLHHCNIKLETDIEPGITLLCHPVQISQVLLNLIHNSIDALESEGEQWIKIKAQTSEKNIIITLIDSGPGIDSSIVTRMMDPFFTTKEVGKGTGLGLSISTGLIEEHHGSLQYRRIDGHTAFQITLPKPTHQRQHPAA